MDLTLTARLGRGRTVETLAGTQTRSGRRIDVAVKRLRPELKDDPEIAKALIGWGRAQLDLEHESVVSVLGPRWPTKRAAAIFIAMLMVDARTSSAPRKM